MRNQSESRSEFMQLNDDCLLELFKYLSAEDLCALKQTNVRLKFLTDYHFHSIYDLKEREVSIRHTDGCKLREILMNCGRFVRHLVIDSPRRYSDMDDFNEKCDGPAYDTYIGNLLANYCSEKLQILKLNCVFLSGFCIPNLENALGNVHTIEMVQCCGNGDRILSYCKNVKTLIQRNCGFFNTSSQHYLLQNEHEALENLVIQSDHQSDITPEVLIEFLRNKRNIRQFHYLNRVSPAPTFLLPIFAEFVTNLEEMCIELESFSRQFAIDLESLIHLSHLKRLEFNTDEVSIESFVDELARRDKLECFGVSDVCLNERLCNSMIKMTKLKALKLIAPLRSYDEFFKILSQHLINLKEVYLVQCADVYFGDLMAFVENLPKLRKLYLYENIYVDWNDGDGCMQFTIDFVHLYKIRSNMVNASPINVSFDSNMMKLIEENVWPHEYEWCTKNNVLRLTLADDDIVNTLPGFCPKIIE